MAPPVRHYGTWRIRWIGPDGKRRSGTYERPGDAKLALHRHQLEAEEIRHGWQPPPCPERTFIELAGDGRTHRAPNERSGRDDESIVRRHLLPAFGGWKLRDMTIERVDMFARDFPSGPKTLHNVLTLLIAMLNDPVDRGWLDRRPRIRKPRLVADSRAVNYLRTDEEIRRFLLAAKEQGESVFSCCRPAARARGGRPGPEPQPDAIPTPANRPTRMSRLLYGKFQRIE